MTEQEYINLMTGRTAEENDEIDAFIHYSVVVEILKGWTNKHNELIELQREYIDFLSKDIPGNAIFLYMHGQVVNPDIVKEGEKLRNNILKLQKELYVY
jgi:hypothetical protein